MDALVDNNLSPKLCRILLTIFSSARHVQDVPGLGRDAKDSDIWRMGRERRWVIVTKDADFPVRALVDGPPPKVVHIAEGNLSTRSAEVLIAGAEETIRTFLEDSGAATLILR